MFGQAVLRGLNAGLVMLGLSCFIFMVMAWLHVENHALLREWFFLISYTAILLAFTLSTIRNLKKAPPIRRLSLIVRASIVPLVVFVPLGTAAFMLIRYVNQATAANIPDWLSTNALFAILLMTLIAVVEWMALKRAAYVENGKK